MSKIKTNTAKVMTGAALVALSSFVPQPYMQQANAAATTINVLGSFVTGVQLSLLTNVNLGKVLATAPTGTVQLKETGAFTVTVGAKSLSGKAAGSIKATFANSTAAFNITVAGFKTNTALTAATGGGAGPTGKVTFDKLLLGGSALDAQVIVVSGGGGAVAGSGKATGNAAATSSKNIDVGARVSFTGGAPVGQFSFPAVVTMAF